MGLQIERAHRFHRREMAAQRIGIAAVAVLLLAALLGTFGGGGPLNDTVQPAPDGAFDLSYHRFLHRETSESLTVSVAGSAVTSDHVDLEVAAGWLERVRISAVVPEPAAETGAADGMRFQFAADPGTPLTVQFHFRPTEVGVLDGWVRLVPRERISLTQYVYP